MPNRWSGILSAIWKDWLEKIKHEEKHQYKEKLLRFFVVVKG
jgi:hypothetical protein